MTNVAGHLREQNGMYQMILSWKDTDGKRRTKSISTGLPVKGNKKRAESLLRKTQKEFNPETMQQVSDLPVSEYLNRWLRESVMNLPPETYGRYAYDLGRVVVPYFEKKRLSLKALSPRDLETFFRYERQQEEASVQQLLDWHKELTDALQYAVDNNWLKVSPIKEVDPCLDNSPVLFTDFITDWLKMMKSRVEITTYTSYERAIIHKIVPYFEPLHYTLQDMEQHPKYIQDFYQHELDRGLTANTVIHYHANIRKCLQYAFQIGMIRSNPADRVERPRKEKFKSEIVMGVFDITQSVVNDSAGVIISDTSIDIATVITDIEAKLDAMSVGGLLGLWFQSLFVGLTMKALSICIMLVVYGRMIEIYLVTSIAPIPVATMVNREWGGMGQNYLKSLLALGFQAFLILVCVGIYAVLIQTIAATDDISGAIWSCMGYTVLLCFTLFKTGSLAKSVFSAH